MEPLNEDEWSSGIACSEKIKTLLSLTDELTIVNLTVTVL